MTRGLGIGRDAGKRSGPRSTRSCLTRGHPREWRVRRRSFDFAQDDSFVGGSGRWWDGCLVFLRGPWSCLTYGLKVGGGSDADPSTSLRMTGFGKASVLVVRVSCLPAWAVELSDIRAQGGWRVQTPSTSLRMTVLLGEGRWRGGCLVFLRGPWCCLTYGLEVGGGSDAESFDFAQDDRFVGELVVGWGGRGWDSRGERFGRLGQVESRGIPRLRSE